MLEGHWKGYYEQEYFPRSNSEKSGPQHFGIEAWFEPGGDDFSGSMKDIDLVYEVLFAEYFAMRKSDYNIKQRLEWQLFLIRDPNALLIFNFFPDSVIKGSYKDGYVRFTKNYLGSCKETFLSNGWQRVVEHPVPHLVYEGQLYDEGNTIKGLYTVASGSLTEQPSFEQGYFELHKVD